MPKNILIFSDGTDNDTGGLADQPNPIIKEDSALSNVYRLYVASNPDYQSSISCAEQVSFYDAGLGSKENSDGEIQADMGGWVPKPLYKLLSKMSGFGITQNISDCYLFLVNNYSPGDRIFLFGFSRGAYTVRSLGGVLSLLGVLKCEGLSESEIKTRVGQSVEIYKIRDAEERKRLSSEVADQYHKVLPHAVCVFDTVRALGLTSGTVGLLDKLGDRFAPHQFHDHTLNPNVPFAFHAVSVDEERKQFKVELWNNAKSNDQVLEQVWFPGVHSDIGGSYRDSESGTGRDLGRLTLEWMIDQLKSHKTDFKIAREALDLKSKDEAKDYHLGDIHNERDSKKFFGLAPTGKLWPKGLRENAKLAPLAPDSHDPNRVGQISRKVKDRHVAIDSYRPESLVGNHPDF